VVAVSLSGGARQLRLEQGCGQLALQPHQGALPQQHAGEDRVKTACNSE